MSQFKLHLHKRRHDGKLFVNKAECGRGAFTKNGAMNHMLKTKAFKANYEHDNKSVCSVCLKRAQEQGRI